MRRLIITSSLIGVFLLIGTLAAVLYARGYRIVPEKNGKPILAGTGLLVTTSKPDGAKVLINNELTTATNNTINLAPGEYEIKITKEGYFPWKKNVTIQKEIVTQANALLLPLAPKLEAMTLTGASSPLIDPTNTLISYIVSTSTPDKNGIYILNTTANPLLRLGGAATQIADNTLIDFSNAQLSFAPDGKELMAVVSTNPATPAAGITTVYLLRTDRFNQNPEDITFTLETTQAEWDMRGKITEQKQINSLPRKVRPLINSYISLPKYSVEGDKILYTASKSANLPVIIKPRLIGTNSTEEDRELKEGGIYVYDIKEDRNYLIFPKEKRDEIQNLMWFPDSNHLVYVEDKKVYMVEFDGKNTTTIYSGPFDQNFVYPWPDELSLLLLTNLNSPDNPFNLYTLSLK